MDFSSVYRNDIEVSKRAKFLRYPICRLYGKLIRYIELFDTLSKATTGVMSFENRTTGVWHLVSHPVLQTKKIVFAVFARERTADCCSLVSR